MEVQLGVKGRSADRCVPRICRAGTATEGRARAPASQQFEARLTPHDRI
jgi:hypothetical protein